MQPEGWLTPPLAYVTQPNLFLGMHSVVLTPAVLMVLEGLKPAKKSRIPAPVG